MESVTAAPSRQEIRNYILYAAGLAILVAVHFLLAANPSATKSVAQAAVFSWTALAIVGGCGLLGVIFLAPARLSGLWNADPPPAQKFWLPLFVGLVLGAAAVAGDLATGWSHKTAEMMHLATIHIAFPLSIPIYLGGAILVTIIYYLTLLPPLDWPWATCCSTSRRCGSSGGAASLPPSLCVSLSMPCGMFSTDCLADRNAFSWNWLVKRERPGCS